MTYSPASYTPIYNDRLKEIRVGSVSGAIDSAFTYDNEGRMTTQTGTTPRSYSWDAKGRLTSEGTETYAYDPLNRRTGGTLGTLDYFLEGEHLESVYKGNKIQEKYFRGLSIDELVAGFTTQNNKLTPFFFQHDQVNSVVAVSKPNGGTQQRASYRAFGEDKAGTGTAVSRLKYTGREDDGTGLYQYRARYYDPRVGRFISEDPKRFEAGVNFYAYVENNPVNASDPSGNDAFFFHGVQAYQAARQLNWSFSDSLSLGYNVAMQDFRTPSGGNSSSTIQNLHGTGGLLPNGQPQSAQGRYQGVTSALNNPKVGLELSGIPVTPQNILYSQVHNAEDIANNGHRNGVYEGFKTGGVWSSVSSAAETLYHFTVLDTIQPLMNWGQRVDNAKTAILANQTGASMGFNQVTGAVYLSSPMNDFFKKIYGKK